MTRTLRMVVGLGLLLASSACRTKVAPPVVSSGAGGGSPEAAYAAVLKAAVQPDGRVDYDVVQARRADLERYLAWVAEPRPPPARSNFQRGRWINIHNALMLWSVLRADRPDSLRDLFSIYPWDDDTAVSYGQAFQVDGRWTSLWEIRHERLRGRLQSTLDLAGLYLAREDGPPLRDEPYPVRQTDKALRSQMGVWLNHPTRGARVVDGTLVLPPLFEDYAGDFDFFHPGQTRCEVVARWVNPPLQPKVQALAKGDCAVAYAPRRPRVDDASRQEAGTSTD